MLPSWGIGYVVTMKGSPNSLLSVLLIHETNKKINIEMAWWHNYTVKTYVAGLTKSPAIWPTQIQVIHATSHVTLEKEKDPDSLGLG